MDEDIFQAMVDGIIDGVADHGFGIGDGLDHDAGRDEESDGHFVLRVFNYDDKTETRHTFRLDVTAIVERIEED